VIIKNKIAIIGNFDGIHIGHRRILWYALKRGKELNYKTLAVSFNPHPQAYFGKKIKLIQPVEDKVKMIKDMGIDEVSILDFSEVVHLSPEEFIDYLIDKHNIKAIVVGDEFRFGKNRGGDLSYLRKIGRQKGISVKGVKVFRIFGEKVSSSRIREYLLNGELQRARLMLGGFYTYKSIVIKGRGVGRKLGFPTANLKYDENFLLKEGVYITKTLYKDRYFNSLTHVGTVPTFNHSEKKIETLIFDFNEKIYGEEIKIFFTDRVRDIESFDNPESLKEAIKKDYDYAISFINDY